MDQADSKTFRSSQSLVPMSVISLCYGLVGVSLLAVAPAVFNKVFGAVFLILSVYLAVLAMTERLTVTAQGVEFRHNFRRTAIPWPAIHSFDIGVSRSMVRWPCLIINSDSGRVSVMVCPMGPGEGSLSHDGEHA